MSKSRVFHKALAAALLIFVLVGCGAPAATPPSTAEPTPAVTEAPTEAAPTRLPTSSPADPQEATPPPGWETHTGEASQGACGYTISHPADMQGTSQGTYSWSLSSKRTEPSGPVPNFIYVSVIPAGFQGGPGEIYNYDPAAAETLLNMQVGETKALHEFANSTQGFTYTRLPDTTLSNQGAQTYENLQPWEFPAGTKEIRYFLQGNGCTYLLGGYMDTTGSDQLGAIDEELFHQIIATFRLTP